MTTDANIAAQSENQAHINAEIKQLTRAFDEAASKAHTKNLKHRLLRYFQYEHLPPHLRVVSAQFHALAMQITNQEGVIDEAERTVAIRKLLEAKDCAVRAMLT